MISAGLVKFQSNSIQDMHMKVYSLRIWLLSQFFLKIGHHLPSNTILTIGLKHTKSQDVCMLLLFVVLDSNSVCANHYIIVIGIFWKLSVLGCNFHVETCRVFDRESLEIELTQDIYILIIDLPHCNREDLLFVLRHIFKNNY